MRPIEFTEGGSVGLDFGTTNSAIATVRDARPALADFHTAAGSTPTFPSVLYFERRREGALTRLTSAAGPAAIERYLDAEDKGRLIQSLKAYLGDRRFDGTAVFSQRYTLEDMIALIGRHLLSDASASFGKMPNRRSSGAPSISRTPRTTQTMSSRSDGCAARSVSAASRRSSSSTSRSRPPTATSRRSFVTSSSSLATSEAARATSPSFTSVRPCGSAATRSDIVGTDGVGIAGDAFDKQILRRLVAPRLGLGSEYFSPPDKFLPIPSWPYEKLERWHHLSFLNTAKNLEMLEHLRRNAIIPERLEAFVHLIKSERATGCMRRSGKRSSIFPSTTEALFEFGCEPVTISKRVTRLEFEKWISAEVQLMAGCVDRLLNTTGVSARDIDHVFLTGGSSFVPAVRNIFVERFGIDKITGGAELTSVATGLSLRAQEAWPA